MLRKETREVSEKENMKRKQAALQTKGQKRWRAKGSSLNAIISEYSREQESGPGFITTYTDDEDADFAY